VAFTRIARLRHFIVNVNGDIDVADIIVSRVAHFTQSFLVWISHPMVRFLMTLWAVRARYRLTGILICATSWVLVILIAGEWTAWIGLFFRLILIYELVEVTSWIAVWFALIILQFDALTTCTVWISTIILSTHVVTIAIRSIACACATKYKFDSLSIFLGRL